MRKLTWIDWVAASVAVLLLPLAWLGLRRKPRERRRARKKLNRMAPGPQIRR